MNPFTFFGEVISMLVVFGVFMILVDLLFSRYTTISDWLLWRKWRRRIRAQRERNLQRRYGDRKD